jgi:hypothetical protein
MTYQYNITIIYIIFFYQTTFSIHERRKGDSPSWDSPGYLSIAVMAIFFLYTIAFSLEIQTYIIW